MNEQRCGDDLNKIIANELKKLRHERKITQETVRFDNDEINIGRIESAKHEPKIKTLKRLLEFYGITLAEFFERINL